MKRKQGRPIVKDKRIRVSFMAHTSIYEKAIKAQGSKEQVDLLLETKLEALGKNNKGF